MHLIEESRPIKEHIQQQNGNKLAQKKLKRINRRLKAYKWKKATNEYIKGKEVISKSSERKPSLELKKKTFRRSGETRDIKKDK